MRMYTNSFPAANALRITFDTPRTWKAPSMLVWVCSERRIWLSSS